MKREKISDKKQIIILTIIIIFLIVFAIISNLFLFNEDNITTSSSTSSDTTLSLSDNTSSSEEEGSETRKVNGKTKSEWEKIEAYIDLTSYEIIMATFEDDNNFVESNNITIDIDEIIDEEYTDEEELLLENYIFTSIEEIDN